MGRWEGQAEDRFEEYVHRLVDAVGHADRREPLRAYLTGLLLSGERKSVEPMAARIEPRRVGARHQSMHHFVAKAPWDDQAVLSTARDYALGQLERHAPVAAWIVDDTAIPKKGKHSVGVARQWCSVLGKQDNCQVAVTVSLANSAMSVPCAWRLYLAEEWAQDRKRRKVAGIPNEVEFRKKWQIALEEIDRLLADDLPRRTGRGRLRVRIDHGVSRRNHGSRAVVRRRCDEGDDRVARRIGASGAPSPERPRTPPHSASPIAPSLSRVRVRACPSVAGFVVEDPAMARGNEGHHAVSVCSVSRARGAS